MTVAEVRKRYLAYFAARGHVVIPSAPIVPGNDPTTLFTSSGMQPLVPYLLGQPHPEGVKLVNSQLSFRAGDIEEVGDNRHTTFFEMLGNWSLGDYFKREQIEWIFEFLVDIVKVDPNKLYITCFIGAPEYNIPKDTEAAETWQRLFESKNISSATAEIGSEEDGYKKGMKTNARIFYYDGQKNWWNRGKTGPVTTPVGDPCGPDSEMFFDFGTPHDPKWGEFCHVNCDCGRFMEIGNNVFMAYRKIAEGQFIPLEKPNIDHGSGLERIVSAILDLPDVFLVDVFDSAREVLEKRSGKAYGNDEEATKAFRIILDHIRAASFMLAEDIVPSNTEAGYVLRRLIRRAIRETDRLGITDAVLPEVAKGYGEVYKDHYPHVLAHATKIADELAKEEEQFRKTLVNGLKVLEKRISVKANAPLFDLASQASIQPLPSEKFVDGETAYDLYTTYGFPVELTQELALEKGMQVDTEEFQKFMEKHQDTSRAGGAQRFAGGLADHSEQTVRYHTTHHILLKALQMVLGEEVKQRGSNITSERLRIDFSSPGKMTDEQKTEVEKIVNDLIYQDLPVTRTVMPREEAEKLGAQMEFGVKYPDMVSVYSVGPAHATEENPDIPHAFSLEFCGGPHVSNTSEIHEGGMHFNIQKEEAVAAGIRRIKAILS